MTSNNKNINLTQGNITNSSNNSMQNSYETGFDGDMQKAKQYNEKMSSSSTSSLVGSSPIIGRIASPSGSAKHLIIKDKIND